MACVCEHCNRNADTLGVAGKALSQAVLRKAFRAAARRWHPDRFETEPAKRAEAEETFKRMHVAYRELWEHVETPILLAPAERAAGATAAPPAPVAPAIFFGGLAGCYTAPHFPYYVAEFLTRHLHEREQALAFVELSRRSPLGGAPAEYVFFTSYRILVRNALSTISMLWYTDLGEIRLVDQYRNGRMSLRQQLAASLFGNRQRYWLEIGRLGGPLFCTFTAAPDDSAKKVIYNFLRQMKA